MSLKHYIPLLALITLLGLALRLLWLEHHSLFIDELYSARNSIRLYQDPIGEALKLKGVAGFFPITFGLIFNGVDLGAAAPLSPALWANQGITPWSLRIVPALIGSATIPLLAYPSKKIFGGETSLIIALLLALSPWHLFWSQLGRFYITQFLFFSLALIFYYSAKEERSLPKFCLSGLFAVVAFLCQFTSLVIFPIIAADWLFNTEKPKGQRQLAIALIFLLTMLLTLTLATLTLNDKNWLTHSSHHTLPQLRFLISTLLLIGPAVVIFSLIAYRTEKSRLTTFLLLAAIIPLIVFCIANHKGHYRPRYAFMSLFPWLGLAAIGCHKLPKKWIVLPIIPFLVADAFYYQSSGLRPRWKEAVEYVKTRALPGDKVIFTEDWLAQYYLATLPIESTTKTEEATWLIIRRKKKNPTEPEITFYSQDNLGKPYALDIYR